MKSAIYGMTGFMILAVVAACSPTPVGIKFEKDMYVLEGPDAEDKIVAYGVDADGNKITEGLNYTFFCEKRDIVISSNDGTIKAVASGEETVEAEIVGYDIKATVKIRVKIPTDIEVSHEKLSLWVGQVKKNVAAWVVSEKGAYVEGYTPKWISADPTIVSVKDIPDPTRGKMQKSYVEMKGLKSGDTTISAVFEGMEKEITVRVYREDEELDLSGRRKPPVEEQEKETKKKKKSGKKR
ncbi:MAG: hypothetical protein JXX14_12665 [Deltaproteobacteria bacterium]|nr:hypothetical protein [Deltaproteobacteria bacterium]